MQAKAPIIFDHRELQVGAFAISSVKDQLVLAGKSFIALVDVDAPAKPVVTLRRESRWENGLCAWSGLADIFAVTSNRSIEVYQRTPNALKLLSGVVGHSRTINDISWSPFQVDDFVTSSVGGRSFIWDWKDTRRPTASFSVTGNIVQCKWSHENRDVLASAQDGGDIRIWDRRKLNAPVAFFTAHAGRINSLEFKPGSDHFVTAGQDGAVRMWKTKLTNTGNANSPIQEHVGSMAVSKLTFQTQVPAGMMASISTLCFLNAEHSVALWNSSALRKGPETLLRGYEDALIDVEFWNRGGSDDKLFTFSKDQKLRVWTVQAYPTTDSEGEDGETPISRRQTVSNGSMTDSPDEESLGGPAASAPHVSQSFLERRREEAKEQRKSHHYLKSEPGYHENHKRSTSEIASALSHTSSGPLGTYWFFPDSRVPFPRSTGAKFSSVGTLVCFGRVLGSSEVTISGSTPKSLAALTTSKSSLEPGSVQQYYHTFLSQRKTSNRSDIDVGLGAAARDEEYVMPIENAQIQIYDMSKLIPLDYNFAKLCDLKAYPRLRLGQPEEMKRKDKYLRQEFEPKRFTVPVNKLGDLSQFCKACEEAARKANRPDLFQLWRMAGRSFAPSVLDSPPPTVVMPDVPWTRHPFGPKMFQQLIQKYVRIGDVQTATLLGSLFTGSCGIAVNIPQSFERRPHPPSSVAGRTANEPDWAAVSTEKLSNSNTVCLAKSEKGVLAYHMQQSRNRSNSLTDGTPTGSAGPPPASPLTESVTLLSPSPTMSAGLPALPLMLPSPARKPMESQTSAEPPIGVAESDSFCFREPLVSPEVAAMIRCAYVKYRDVLNRWQLHNERALLDQIMAFNYDNFTAEPTSTDLRCAVCRSTVRGIFLPCPKCGHGGHPAHVKLWFESNRSCPSCSCMCLPLPL